MEIEQNKEAAVHFLRMIVEGNIDAAYQKYVNPDGKHHNVYFPKGFPALQKGMQENHDKFPEKQLTVKHVLGDSDLVAVHSHVVHQQGQQGVSVVHLFRFTEGQIVEMWDCGMEIPAASPNEDGAF